jgi:hypothetical protein
MPLLIKTLKAPRNFFLLSNLSYKKRLTKICNKTPFNKRKTNFVQINAFRRFNSEKQLSKN